MTAHLPIPDVAGAAHTHLGAPHGHFWVLLWALSFGLCKLEHHFTYKPKPSITLGPTRCVSTAYIHLFFFFWPDELGQARPDKEKKRIGPA
jgi:hypothetical protein